MLKLFFILTLSLLSGLNLQANEELLFERVFGKSQSKQIVDTDIRLVVGTGFIGDLSVRVNAVGDIVEISRSHLIEILKSKLSDHGLKKLQELPEMFAPDSFATLGISAQYDVSALTLLLRLPVSFEKPYVSSWKSMIPEWASDAKKPDDWSLALNTALRQSFSYGDVYESQKRSESFVGTDMAFQFHQWVLEASADYSTLDSVVRRGDVRLVRDFPAHLSRLQLGDIIYPVMGLQNSLSMGGIGVSRETTLDPYRIITPLNDQEFYLSSKSLVKVYVNSQLVRSVFLPAGRHSLLDLPLNNGVNEIRLDIRDFYGEESTLTFKRFTGAKLLREGFIEYSANVGVLRTESFNERKYNEDHLGMIFNSFWRRGMGNSWTTGGFLLTNIERNNVGVENTISTPIGIWSHEAALSIFDENKASDNKGIISKLEYTYQVSSLDGVGSRYQLTHEFESSHYRNFLDGDAVSERAHTFRAAQGFDLSSSISLNLGLAYSLYRVGVDGYGANISASWRLLDDWLLSSYISKERDNYSKWSEGYYLFLTWNIPESGQSLTASYDGQNKLQRLDWMSAPNSRLSSIESRASIQNDDSETRADFQGSYLGSRGQLTLEQEVGRSKVLDQTRGRTTVGASFGLGVVPGGFAFGRPIRGAFAVVAPHEDLGESKLGVGTSAFSSEAEINEWGSALLPELTSYQYTMLNIDSRELDPGLNLGDETIVIFPGHKTGQLVTIGGKGVIMAMGTLTINGLPIALKLGVAIDESGEQIPFFTDREGKFFLEKLSAKIYRLKVEEFEGVLDLRGEKMGLKRVAQLELR